MESKPKYLFLPRLDNEMIPNLTAVYVPMLDILPVSFSNCSTHNHIASFSQLHVDGHYFPFRFHFNLMGCSANTEISYHV